MFPHFFVQEIGLLPDFQGLPDLRYFFGYALVHEVSVELYQHLN